MVDLVNALKRIARSLEDAGVPYAVTGSFASSSFGIYRTTNDIDILIAPTRSTS